MSFALNFTFERIARGFDQSTNVIGSMRHVTWRNGLDTLDVSSITAKQTVLIGSHIFWPKQWKLFNTEVESGVD
jgi:hypothetical protein